jgi:hypothetical protein
MNIEYPYYRTNKIIDKKEIKKRITEYKPEIYTEKINEFRNMEIEKFQDNYFIIKDIFEETKEINNITDYFSEKIRVKCKFGNNLSPLDYWNKNKKNIIEKTKKNIIILNFIIFVK